MSDSHKVIFSAAVAAGLFIGASRLTGQAAPESEHRRSVPIAAAGSALPRALAQVDAMLVSGQLDIARQQEDTMVDGRAFERLGQIYEGLPVFGGQVVRQIDGRAAVSVTGRLYGNVDVDATPTISPAAAQQQALDSAGVEAQIHGDPVLGILPINDGYRLAFRIEVRSPLTIRIVFVDAATGSIIQSLNGIHSQSEIGRGNGVFGSDRKLSTNRTTAGYQAVDLLRPAQSFTLDFRGSFGRFTFFLLTGALFNSDTAVDSDNQWNDGPIVDAHAYQGWVYDYYYTRFGRRGMDGRDGEVDGITHPIARSEASTQPPDVVGNYINNAFYCCGGVLVYGDGDGRSFDYLAGAFDVVAHEWTHGVTDYSSGLIYEDESGALNEAFSDIMAASMEFREQPVGTGRERADWTIAEDVVLSAPGFLRSLSNPSAGGEPDHYSLRRYIGTDVDDGGVHYNLTIVTHAYFLAVAGGRNRISGIEVPGVGLGNIEHMEKIFYRAFTMLMAPNATFSDARRATLQAAVDLYGQSSNDRVQLELAWTAVGVN